MANRKMEEWRKASKSCQIELTKNIKPYKKATQSIMLLAAEEFLKAAESQPKSLVPYYTGNLMDSLGVRLLNGNQLVGYRTMVETTTQHAMKPQHMKGVKGDIWGEVELMSRILRPSRRTGRGVVAQMMVGVPYAGNVGISDYEIDIVGYHAEYELDYINGLRDIFVDKIQTFTKLLEKYPKMTITA